MRVSESFRSSFRALSHSKMRTFLTMLGVIIGVFSVVMLTSIGEGVKQQVAFEVESLGANLLYVFPGRMEMPTMSQTGSKLGVRTGFGSLVSAKSSLTYEDVLALKECEHIECATGIVAGVDRLDKLNILVSTTGVDEDFFRIRAPELRYGRYMTLEERDAKSRVAVIGSQANEEIFEGCNSIGETFDLNGVPYEVVGVLQHKKVEGMGPGAEDLNVKIYLPVSEVLDRSEDQSVGQIVVRAVSPKAVDSAKDAISQMLRERHGTVDFTVVTQDDILASINRILSVLSAAMAGIAAISLVVGGIGIMNIMLVSVTERTREIGVRKAIGAKRRDILIQFLIEAVVISLLGGIIGLLMGIGGSAALTRIAPDIPTAISITAVVVSLLFASGVGCFFGVYPAAKAAGLDPIEAVRGE
ncbi:MAG: ABC transporter permease [Bacillota bacterium]